MSSRRRAARSCDRAVTGGNTAPWASKGAEAPHPVFARQPYCFASETAGGKDRRYSKMIDVPGTDIWTSQAAIRRLAQFHS
jgi:hypothetical protein